MARRTEDDPKRFLDPKTIARISQLDLRARQVVEGFLTGMHKSPAFGQSVSVRGGYAAFAADQGHDPGFNTSGMTIAIHE